MVDSCKSSFCILLVLLQVVIVVSARNYGIKSAELPCCAACCYHGTTATSVTSKGKSVKSTDVMGSRPPSCLNKCASCTPCNLVKAGSMKENKIGSGPPRCNNKCNNCVPCQPVQAPMSTAARQGEGHSTVGFSNYKPETWKCQCGNKYFSP